MGLSGLLDRAAASRVHVLVAEAPGAFRSRVALERALQGRGGCTAESVADADVLAVVGEPGAALAQVIEHVWAQMSEPRLRIHVRAETEVHRRLDDAREQLRRDTGRLTAHDVRRGFTPSAHHDDGGDDHSAMMPDGIPLAEGAEDRDGLEMDELHLPLGPVLTHWCPGLVLRLTLRGDVVSDATVEQLAAGPGTSTAPPTGGDRAAMLLDAAGSVLALAGLTSEAARTWRLRDRCLDGARDVGPDVARQRERVGRLRVLRWVLGGLTIAGSHGGSEQLLERLLGLFERARAELDGQGSVQVLPGAAALPRLVRGMELASLRLWLAAMAPDLAETTSSKVAHD